MNGQQQYLIDPRFNTKVIERLLEYKFEDAMMHRALYYLLGIHYGLDTSFFSEELVRQVNLTRIVERLYTPISSVVWNIPLFEEVVVAKLEDQWTWIESYREFFGTIGGLKKMGDGKACLTKMKKFFAEHPDVRVNEVIDAVKEYLTPFRDGTTPLTYLQQADYFISKQENEGGTRVMKSRLLQHIEIVRRKRQATEVQGGDYGQMKKLIR